MQAMSTKATAQPSVDANARPPAQDQQGWLTRMSLAQRFLVATTLAKRFRLTDKADRIALFQAVLYGADVSGEGGAE